MPLSVEEIKIGMTVSGSSGPGEPGGRHGVHGHHEAENRSPEHEALVRECVRRVIRILRESKER